MTSLAHQFDLVDPSRLVMTSDGSVHAASVPPHFLLTGQIEAGPATSSSADHAGARRVLYQAWLRVMSRPPSVAEVQGVQAIALHESGYGHLSVSPESHNWGNVQCPGTWGATECPADCFMGHDVLPPTGTSSQPVKGAVCFRAYPDDVTGAIDLVRNVTTARPRTMKALATGDADAIAGAMYAERYYTGISKTPAVNVAAYAGGLERRAREIAKALHENALVTRRGQPRDMIHLGSVVPLAAVFAAIALRRHFGIAGDVPPELAAAGDILPTFVSPDDAKRYVRETDAQWDRTDVDVQASSQVDAAFKQSWATDLEGWRRFRDDAVNSVGWLNTKATMEQTDRWVQKLTAWRQSLTAAGGKVTGPGPVASGQGTEGGKASAGWVQLALLVAALFGIGYLVRGFKA